MLAEENLSLARKIASKYEYETRIDSFSVAYEALVLAVQRYDWRKGFSLASFATRTIKGKILHEIRDQASTIRSPREVFDAHRAISRAEEALMSQGVLVTPAAIAELSGLDVGVVEETFRFDLSLAAKPDSLDQPLPNSEVVRSDTVVDGRSDFTDGVIDAVAFGQMITFIQHLPEKERVALINTRLLGRRTAEIAEEMGVSTSSVCRLALSAIAKLQAMVKEANPEQ